MKRHITDEAVEAAAKANYEASESANWRESFPWAQMNDREDWIKPQRAAIEAFLQAEDFEVEQNGDSELPHYRLISPWRPER